MLITYGLVCVPSITFLVLVASRISWVIVVLGLASFFLTILFFSMTACSDPGIVYRQILEEEAALEAGGGGQLEGGRTSATQEGTGGDVGFGQGQQAPLGTAGTATTSATTMTQTTAGARTSISSTTGATNVATHIPCSRCEMSRPVGASHCYDCEVCVKDLDHHCPWTGKCIGRKNLYFFYLFLLFLTLHILFVGIVTGLHAINSAFKVADP
jgi:palmitoyltransferase ZDHHC9/14/18